MLDKNTLKVGDRIYGLFGYSEDTWRGTISKIDGNCWSVDTLIRDDNGFYSGGYSLSFDHPVSMTQFFLDKDLKAAKRKKMIKSWKL